MIGQAKPKRVPKLEPNEGTAFLLRLVEYLQAGPNDGPMRLSPVKVHSLMKSFTDALADGPAQRWETVVSKVESALWMARQASAPTAAGQAALDFSSRMSASHPRQATSTQRGMGRWPWW